MSRKIVKAKNTRTGKVYTWSEIIPKNLFSLIELEGLKVIKNGPVTYKAR